MAKDINFKDILKMIKELGTLELWRLEQEVLKEFEKRSKIKLQHI